MRTSLSPNMEMYLKAIGRLGQSREPVRIKAIAETLGVTMPSVSEAMRALNARGLVWHPSYGEVRLSSGGVRVAAAVNRRYDTLLRFLTSVLDVDEATARRDACRIEHSVSADTVRRMAAYLDREPRARSRKTNP